MAALIVHGTRSFYLRDHGKLPMCFYAVDVDDTCEIEITLLLLYVGRPDCG